MSKELHFDFDRVDRIGFSEAVLCRGKTSAQIANILSVVKAHSGSVLLTRLDGTQFAELPEEHQGKLDFDASSATAFYGAPEALWNDKSIAIISAGTSDISVATEARRTLEFHGVCADPINDIGVAGLWRLNQYLDVLTCYETIIVVAGMDGALPSVVGGLFGSVIIAVPTSTGYGTAEGGRTALNAALTSCAPGVVAVNIDNGYGAAIAALRTLGRRPDKQTAPRRAKSTTS